MLTPQGYSSVLRFLEEMPTRNGTLLRYILPLFERHFRAPVSLAITYQKTPGRGRKDTWKYNYIVRDLPLYHVDTYFNRFFAFDLLSRSQNIGGQPVVSVTSLLTPEERDASPYYQFLLEMELPYQCCIFLYEEEDLIATISLFRPETEGDFTPEELEAFAAIEPFLSKRYLENKKNREHMSLSYHFDEYFSNLPLGVALLNHNGMILNANQSFNEFAKIIHDNGGIDESFVTRNTANTSDRFLYGQKLINFLGAQVLFEPEKISLNFLLSKFQFYTKEISGQRRTVIDAGENLYLLFLVRHDKVHSEQILNAMKLLTPRETAVLSYLAAGMSTPQIAKEMGISPFTVKTHLQNIYSKCNVSGRSELLSKLK